MCYSSVRNRQRDSSLALSMGYYTRHCVSGTAGASKVHPLTSQLDRVTLRESVDVVDLVEGMIGRDLTFHLVLPTPASRRALPISIGCAMVQTCLLSACLIELPAAGSIDVCLLQKVRSRRNMGASGKILRPKEDSRGRERSGDGTGGSEGKQ